MCSIWIILIPIIESSRIQIAKLISNENNVKTLFFNNNNSNKNIKREICMKVVKKRTPNAKTKVKTKPSSNFPFPFPLPIKIDFDFSVSLPSMLTGIILTGATLIYLENQDLKTKNLRNRLLLGDLNNEIKRGILKIPSDLTKDPDLFNEALNSGNQDLCLYLLQSGQSIRILNEISGENLLVKVIEKGMSKTMNHLLKNRLNEIRLALDVMDDISGNTPLLSAIQVKDFKSAKALLDLGAKPLIPTTSRFQARHMKHFIPKIEDSDSEEFARELQTKYITHT